MHLRVEKATLEYLVDSGCCLNGSPAESCLGLRRHRVHDHQPTQKG